MVKKATKEVDVMNLLKQARKLRRVARELERNECTQVSWGSDMDSAINSSIVTMRKVATRLEKEHEK